MQIRVDADACPTVIKEILFRAAERLHIPLILVAGRILKIPPSFYIRAMCAGAGFDAADKKLYRKIVIALL
jgi:hypothetical protein